MLLTIVIFLLILGVLILSHELGHFWAARFNGIKVEEFGFGYPPRLFGLQLFKSRRLEKVAEEEVMTVEHTEGEVGQEVDIVKDVVKEVDVLVSKRKWRLVWGAKGVERLREENAGQDGTVYSINLLPLGGFCKIKGEEGGDGKESDSYDTKKPWQKAMVMAGGVVMNILLAAVLLSVGFMIGLPQSTSELSDVSNVQERKLQILSVLPDKPAVQAGIKAGDAIVQLDEIKNPRLKELQSYVDEHKNKKINVTWDSNGQLYTKSIQPTVYSDTGKGGLGISVAETGIMRYVWYKAIYYGFVNTGIYLKEILIAFFLLFKGLFTGGGVAEAVTGPVGIAVMTGRVARMGFVYLVQFTVMLSLNLAIINALPLPALDGGRMLFLLIGKLRGRPVSQRIENGIHIIGFNLLILLAVIITIKDVSAFRDLFANFFKRLF